ncbi:MAG: Lrp/AsnC family transcriptional regulator [Candidatus Hermodarchaeota archaeon]
MVETKEMNDLDDTDKTILNILQNNGKASLRDIEREIGLSTTAIRARLRRLTENHIIKKYMAIIDCRQLGYREMVIASLRVNSSIPLEQIKRKVEEIEQIKYAYIVTGEYPIFLMFKCLDHQDAMSLIEKLRNLPGVEEIKTQLVLDRVKEDHTIIIPD